MAEIIKHNEAIVVADLPGHAIPSLNSLDVVTIKKKGGADLSIVIATPLDGSEESQNRFLSKIRNYLGFINSSDYIEQAGVEPTLDNTNIIIHIHPHSDEVIIDLINRSISWVNENNSNLKVEVLSADN